MHLRFLFYSIFCFWIFGLVSAQSNSEIDSLKLLLTNSPNDSNKVNVFFRISKLYWYSSPDSAELYATKGLELSRSVKFAKGEADCINSLSAVYWMRRNYPVTLNYTLQNLGIRQKIGDTIGIFNASNNLGLIYYETGKYDLALRYMQEALSIASKIKDTRKIAKATANLGIVHMALKDTARAYTNFIKSLEIQTNLKDSLEMSYLYYNIGELLHYRDPREAVSFYQKSLSIAQKQDNKEIMSACLQGLSDQKFRKGKFDESIVLARRALAIATENNHLKVIDLSAQILYKAYFQKRNYRESLKYHIIANEAQDSMMSEKKMAEMSELRYTFDMKQKEEQIELLERDKIITKKNAETQRLIFYVEILIIVLTGVVVFGFYRTYRIRQQKKERVKYEQMLIAAKEKAEENDRLKTAFLCNMSHEIRTPMNAVIGFTDLLIYREVGPEKQKRYLKLIKDHAVDLLHLIEDILDISKIEVGQVKLNSSMISITDLMSEMYEFYNLKISNSPKANPRIVYNPDERLTGRRFMVDAQRLKQILGNLLDNALKFTEEGEIEYGCKIDGDKLLFYVKDSGIGIPKEKQELIFERFRQVDEQLHLKQYGGTGLGLSIVKGLLSLMGGEIWVESVPGEGSIFYFTIPATAKPDK